MKENVLRDHLVNLLRGGQAHVAMDSALEGIDHKLCHTRPGGIKHSLWEVLEHIRIAQHDILHYTLDPKWISPKFPEGYWPGKRIDVSEIDLANSISGFFADLGELVDLTRNPNIDITSEITHAEGHTYLREILVAGQHNTYHLGQIVQIRKTLDNWPE